MPRLIRSWQARVAVAGHSMEPTLRDGDWVLVDPLAYRHKPPQVGDIVVASGTSWLVKRVAAVQPDGTLTLRGDHPAHAGEAIVVEGTRIVGRPWLRYWPIRRMGRLP